jgi:hypothetical protein
VDGFDDDAPSLAELITPPASSPADRSGRIYWRNWPADYDYVYVLGYEQSGANPLPGKLQPVASGAEFRLYKVVRPPSSAASRELAARP